MTNITSAERHRIDHTYHAEPTPRRVRVDAMLPKASTDTLQSISREGHKSHSQVMEEALWLYQQVWNAEKAGGETVVFINGIEQSVHLGAKP